MVLAYISQSNSKVRATGYGTEEYFFREMVYTTDLDLKMATAKANKNRAILKRPLGTWKKRTIVKIN